MSENNLTVTFYFDGGDTAQFEVTDKTEDQIFKQTVHSGEEWVKFENTFIQLSRVNYVSVNESLDSKSQDL
ncbi:hypothetical protein WQ57_19925 [Mesobacillus campisalis]|uniref:Uncharacterized protein n=1 Tax=Mesobacillus campisalis TaxID=1408103 RepID=A0A0M2SRQ8_9BACI|nr:hypothetical protein [Mesobacillus campisalis]KKK36356.1 hypothetical protein WQ57_19925 [Mesobacillus campisalis]